MAVKSKTLKNDSICNMGLESLYIHMKFSEKEFLWCVYFRVTLKIKNSTIFLDIFIIQVNKNSVNWPLISPYNIDKIFCKNPCNIFLIQNSGNLKVYFFLNLYLQIFFVKYVSLISHYISMGCLYDISGLDSA